MWLYMFTILLHELITKHESAVVEFLPKDYDWVNPPIFHVNICLVFTI